jgi:hypothetical protein
MILEDSGTPYVRGKATDAKAESAAVFAMPAAKSPTGTILSQTTAIAQWMAAEVSNGVYNVGAVHVANKVANDIADIWSEGYKARCVIKDTGISAGATEWLADGGRFHRLLNCIQATRALTKSESSEYLFGASVSYVDFLLLNAIITLEYCYGADKIDVILTKSGLKTVVEATRNRPLIKAFLARDLPVLYDGVLSTAIDWTK